jgi:Fatty acid hydroxylase superfamily
MGRMNAAATTTVVTRSDELSTKRATWRAFRRSSSGRVIVPVMAVLAVTRLIVGEWGRGDLAVLMAVAVITGPVEWFIHLFLLHASPDAWTSRRLGTGSGHREHHLDPPELKWLLLRGVDASVFLVLLGIVTSLWAPLLAWTIGGSVWPSLLTAFTVTAAGLGHYEWTHLLVHTKYRPRTRYYARLARNHRRHHYRNERYWLGVTSNLGDRLLRTYPAKPGDVPLSGTARTLGGPGAV